VSSYHAGAFCNIYIGGFYRRILEFAAAIKATFEPVIQTHLYPRSQIDIYVQVLEQDGGKRFTGT